MDQILQGALGALNVLNAEEKSNFFPLHDRYYLLGKNYSELFEPIRDGKSHYGHIKALHIMASLQYQILDEAATAKPEAKEKDKDTSTLSKKKEGLRKQQTSDTHKVNLSHFSPNTQKELQKKALQMVRLVSKLNSSTSPLIEAIKKVARSKDLKNPKEKEREQEAKNYISVIGEISHLYEVKEDVLVNNMWQALETSQPLRNLIVPSLHNRAIDTFSLKRDLSVKYPLSKNFRFKLFNAFKHNPEATLRDYFGEQIALFFDFLTYYRDSLYMPMAYGIILTLIIIFNGLVQGKPLQKSIGSVDFNWVELLYLVSTSLFCIYITFWSLNFISAWRRFESEFAVKYGQTTLENTKEIRPNFVGEYTRSVTDDRMNDMSEESKKVGFKQLITFLFFIGFIIGTFFASYWVLYVKRMACIGDWTKFSFMATIDLDQILGDILEYFRILICQWLFFKIISKLILIQNLKYIEDQERQLLMYVGVYKLINSAAVLIIIALQSLTENIEWSKSPETYVFDPKNPKSCLADKCAAEMSQFFATFCVFQLAFNIITKVVVIPAYRKVASLKNSAPDPLSQKAVNKRKSSMSVDSKKQPEVQTVVLEKNEGENQALANAENFKDFGISEKEAEKQKIAEIVKNYYGEGHKLYRLVDSEIDYQIRSLNDFNESSECEQVLLDYLEIFSSFSLYTMFGVIFPICFFVGFVNGALEWIIVRRWLMTQTRRPKPSASKSIGLWLDMIKTVSLLSIVTNGFYMSFVLLETQQMWSQFTCFLLVTGILFIAHYAINQASDGLSESVEVSMARAVFVQGLLFAKSKTKTAGAKKLKISMAFDLLGKSELPRRSTNVFDVIVKKEGEGGTQQSAQREEDGHEDQGASGEGKTKLEDGDGHDISHGQNNKDGEKVEGVNAGPVPK
jgi:uncharacterized membrane protein YciS (DUF1049 family)